MYVDIYLYPLYKNVTNILFLLFSTKLEKTKPTYLFGQELIIFIHCYNHKTMLIT